MRIRAGCLSVALGAAGLLVSGCSRGAASANDNAPPAKIEAAPEPGVYELKHPEQFPLVRVGTRRMPDELLVNGVLKRGNENPASSWVEMLQGFIEYHESGTSESNRKGKPQENQRDGLLSSAQRSERPGFLVHLDG